MLDLVTQASEGSPKPTRRALLRLGALAPLGLSLPGLLASQASAAPGKAREDGFGSAKRCILLFMWGGPAHQDLWDMKPDAPAEVRGEFKPIATKVPGINICEHLPKLAQHTDKIAFVRSVTHGDNNHSTGAHWMLTGYKHPISAENFGASSKDHPHLGSVLSQLTPARSGLPTFVALPEIIATTAGAVVPGQFGGMAGKRFDPFLINQHPDLPNFKVPSLALPEGLPPERLRQRLDLMRKLQEGGPEGDKGGVAQAWNAFRERAAEMILSPAASQAFDLAAEPDALRDRYGRGTFGQGLLLSRRLLEAGVKLVTVYWHRDKPGVDTTWDTHGQNFKGLKERLIPQVDAPLAAFFEDLQQRGLLDDTLVVWTSEFGRTPKINAGAGRDHWGPCNTIWMAGGGVPGGQVYGASDKQAAYPDRNPVSPADVTATIYHLLGVDPHTMFYDRENRPHAASQGTPLATVISGKALPADIQIVEKPVEKPAKPSGEPNAEILADKPLAYWLVNETSGASIADRMTKSRGKLLGDIGRGDQRFTASVGGWGDTAYSVELCFKNTRPFDADLVTGYLYSRAGADVGGDRDRGEHLGIGGTFRGASQGKLFAFNGDDSEAGSVVGSTSLEVGRWYHLVLQRHGDELTLYLNGRTDSPEFRGKLARHFTAESLFAACRHDGFFNFQGEIRDLAIFSGLLNAERIAAHFKASKIAG